MITENEDFPADLVIIGTSQLDAGCFVLTSSLDGEKNLKVKKVPKNLDKFIPCGGEFIPSSILVIA